MMKTVAATLPVFVQVTVSDWFALPVSIDATHIALAPTHAVAEPVTRLTVGSNVLTVGVTVTESRCPAGTDTRTARSMPGVPWQLLVAFEMKSLAWPTSDWLWFTGSASSGAVSQPSPVTPPPEQSPKLQVWLPAQAMHAAPPPPHAAVEVPARHTSPWQQPPGQVVALQVEPHEVPLHAWPVLQTAQVAPPVPHAAIIVPAWHTLPWQQPPGQLFALQAETHEVPLQLPVPQAAHVLPPRPHAAVLLPGWQTLPWQQPLGQVESSQMKVHWPLTHESAPEHALQVLPPVPHAPFDVPAWHTPPWQHPEGQVAALQVEPPEHRPALHAWPLVHVLQLSPPAPHAPVELPG